MKTLSYALVVLMLSGLGLKPIFSQQKHKCVKEKKCDVQTIPNLTDDQKKKIQQLETNYLNEVQPLQDQLHEKRAHLKTLRNSSAPKQEIDKTIDEITSLENKIMKKYEEHFQSILALLTDDQKVYFKQRCPSLEYRCCGYKFHKDSH